MTEDGVQYPKITEYGSFDLFPTLLAI